MDAPPGPAQTAKGGRSWQGEKARSMPTLQEEVPQGEVAGPPPKLPEASGGGVVLPSLSLQETPSEVSSDGLISTDATSEWDYWALACECDE